MLTSYPCNSSSIKRIISLIALSTFIGVIFSTMTNHANAEKPKYVIIVHGGAGSPPPVGSEELKTTKETGMTEALKAGQAILEKGGSAVDAVEAAVRVMENHPSFNAGRGSVLNADGKVQMDSSIMEGHTMDGGAATLIDRTKNPITLAKRVMQDTDHVLLAGEGAERFSQQRKLEQVDHEYFRTDRQVENWKRKRARDAAKKNNKKKAGISKGETEEDNAAFGTVGCVALDSKGHLAAATSTGGRTNKMVGRVGDSPILGAGTYADKTCAVSGTGYGEQYIRFAVAYDVSAQMRYKKVSLKDAVNDILKNRLNKGDGGLIAIDKDGNTTLQWNTKAMARGVADSNGRFEVFGME